MIKREIQGFHKAAPEQRDIILLKWLLICAVTGMLAAYLRSWSPLLSILGVVVMYLIAVFGGVLFVLYFKNLKLKAHLGRK